ncbi:MAG: hypothetical protein U0736_05210 [Gemmataceae bacterium]
MGALANAEVGRFINEHCIASFQKVGTFRIVGGAKQGGNVAAYFCAPDGRVLHCVAGPVGAERMLQDARWIVETAKTAIRESGGDGGKFKAMIRTAHAQRLKALYGLVVEPMTFDIAEPDPSSALTYQDPTGRPLAPKLPPPPLDGPDVTLARRALEAKQAAAAGGPSAFFLRDRRGIRWVLDNQGESNTCWRALAGEDRGEGRSRRHPRGHPRRTHLDQAGGDRHPLPLAAASGREEVNHKGHKEHKEKKENKEDMKR